jgi:lipid-A-disaccharide synthase
VSLELLARCKPAVVVYRLNWLELKIARPFIKCRFITLVNLLAGEELYPEFLADHDPSERMAARVVRWLDEPAELNRVRQKLRALQERVGQPGACERAACAILGLPVEKAVVDVERVAA